ncbi:MAG TPA: hypothetical protein PK095_12340 [Myxococcota bacterium]|nr:hypothetical protein [Myxococcota bacterium]
MNLKLTLASLALCPLIACGDDDPKATDTADTTQTDTAQPDTAADTTEPDTTADTAPDTTPDTDTTPSSCDKSGFTAVAQDAGTIFGVFTYIAQSTLETPVDVLNLELVETNGGATAPGTFTFDDANYNACGNCLTIWLACDENLGNCQKKFLVQEGTLQIDTFGESGGTLAGHIEDAVLVEVTIGEDFVSTPVANGETWCLDRYDFSTTIQ